MGGKMRIISHRGNLYGPNQKTENSIDSIYSAISLGFDIEIDIWLVDNKLYLGHDSPQYCTSIEWLKNHSDKLWIHCKNMDSLEFLLDYKELNIFGHSNDDFVLTSKQNIFCKPGMKINKRSVIVMPELTPIYSESSFDDCYGVLTDYPINIKEQNYKLFVI
jgi:hypothetical protein